MNFSYMIHAGIVSAALLLGALLRARVRVLQKYLIPSSIIGGALLLLFYNYAAPLFGLDSSFLGDLVYHLLNVSFIAMALRIPEEGGRKSRRAIGANVIAVVAQYGLQCLLPLIAVAVLIATAMPDLFPAIALSLPLGFELGPGQAYSMSLPWVEMGFEGATSVGLAMAAIGFIVGSVGGVILINIGIRKGWVSKEDAAKLEHGGVRSGFIPRSLQKEGARNTTEGESIDSLTYHLALILGTYLLSYGFLSLLGLLLGMLGPLGDSLMDSLWGINFVFSMFCANIVRMVIIKAGVAHTVDNKTMNRINGLAVDFTVISSLGSISIAAVASYWLPVLILVAIGIFITCYILPWYCSRLYDDYQFKRMLIIFGTGTGTLPTGLSLLRVLDPDFETPVATDYVYASGIVFFTVIPIILCVNLPALSYTTQNPMLYWLMVAICAVYTIGCVIAFRIFAGKRAFASPSRFFYTGESRS